MIFKKALSLIAAIAAMAAAAAVCVVAAAYALFALVRDYLGPAGAAAVVALLAAALLGVLALILLRKVRPKPPKGDERDLTTRLIELARDKPIVAAGAAVAAGLVLIRNPKIISTLVTATIAARAPRRERADAESRRKRR